MIAAAIGEDEAPPRQPRNGLGQRRIGYEV